MCACMINKFNHTLQKMEKIHFAKGNFMLRNDKNCILMRVKWFLNKL